MGTKHWWNDHTTVSLKVFQWIVSRKWCWQSVLGICTKSHCWNLRGVEICAIDYFLSPRLIQLIPNRVCLTPMLLPFHKIYNRQRVLFTLYCRTFMSLPSHWKQSVSGLALLKGNSLALSHGPWHCYNFLGCVASTIIFCLFYFFVFLYAHPTLISKQKWKLESSQS